MIKILACVKKKCVCISVCSLKMGSEGRGRYGRREGGRILQVWGLGQPAHSWPDTENKYEVTNEDEFFP